MTDRNKKMKNHYAIKTKWPLQSGRSYFKGSKIALGESIFRSFPETKWFIYPMYDN